MTYGNCTYGWYDRPFSHRDVPSLALLSFPSLREFSWAGLSIHEYDALAPLLQHRATQLTKLELDLEYHVFRAGFRALPFFSKKVLQLHRPGSIVFSALKSLSLSNVVLDSHDFAIAGSIDFSNLEHLKLRFCPGTERVLQHLAESGSSKLRVVEINMGFSALSATDQQGILIAFLESFQGLQALYINMLYWPTGLTTGVWRAVGRHSKTLWRFAYHQRQAAEDVFGAARGSFIGAGITVYDALNVELSEAADLDGKVPDNPLRHLDLRGLGLGCSPKCMMPLVSPFSHKSSLQLLHMRRSGLDFMVDESLLGTLRRPDIPAEQIIQDARDTFRLDLHRFLQWVFGPCGIGSLQLFVYGDFSHGDRYRQHWKMMCRNERPKAGAGNAEPMFYREVTEEDQGLLSLLEEHEGLVSALANDALFCTMPPVGHGAQ
ncbi:hypothetical protein PG996_004814 [Apiospora saccharicola]|uniref:Uncharacterized protein n=1 Tax=Apiospora saccharicola TaxID=335842 RepID=A0ABR1W586_9PEZI